MDSDCEPSAPLLDITSQNEGLNQEEQAMIWWVVAFTCVFETVHSVSSRAIGWLLQLLGSLLHCLGHYSQQIARIAHAFPCTLHQRSKYLKEKMSLLSVRQYVVCHDCLSLMSTKPVLNEKRRGSLSSVKMCPQCESTRKNAPLLKGVIFSSETKKHYPFLVYPYVSLVSSLHFLLALKKGVAFKLHTILPYFTIIHI